MLLVATEQRAHLIMPGAAGAPPGSTQPHGPAMGPAHENRVEPVAGPWWSRPKEPGLAWKPGLKRPGSCGGVALPGFAVQGWGQAGPSFAYCVDRASRAILEI